MRRLLAALLVAGALTAATPAYACACGGVVDQPGGDTSVSSETALVVLDGGSETILLRLGTRTDAVTAGLLVPTPTAASVALGDDEVFTDLARVSAPQQKQRWRLFGPPLLGGGGGDGASAGAAGPGVQVLQSVDLGPLRVTTLTAADATVLDTWMRTHGLEPTPELAQAVKPYVDEGWSFVAVQLSAASRTLDGELPPIAMTFASDVAVYPMRMSSVADQPQQPLVYVLADHRMERTDPVADGLTRPDLRFAGEVSPAAVSSPALRAWLGRSPYLTAFSQWLPEPAQIVSDFTFGQAPSDAEYRIVFYDDSSLIPADVGVLLGLLLLVGGGWMVLRWSRRPSPSSGEPGTARIPEGTEITPAPSLDRSNSGSDWS